MDWILFLSQEWLLVTILCALLVALFYVEQQRSGVSLGLADVSRKLNSGEAVLLDVRESKEFNAGHIVDALNIPYAKLKDHQSELEKYRSKTVIVVDKMGQHAGAAAKLLREQGFEVVRMRGGMTEWLGQNLPVVR